MKLKTPKRPNFSRSAKLCDQTFYHDSQPVHHLDNDTSPLNKPLTQRKSSTYGFSSVSREKKSNFRFPIRLPVGEFTYYPNHSYGRNKEPTWSFNKTQRYEKIPIIEYEVCERHPALQEDQQVKLRASATSMKEFMKDKIRANRSSSYFSLKDKSTSQLSKDTRYSRNYSIIQPQQTSQVGFYTKTKIQHPLYLSKQDLNQLEGQLDEKHYQQRLQPCSNGYIQFSKRRSRQPNRNSKGFETFLYSNTDQNQFNNYHQTQFPCGPIGHIQMQKHLNRPDYMPDRLGPNTEPFSIDGVRVNQNHIDLHLQKFRDKVTTRYDRVGPQPNTRLHYDVKPKELPPMLQMDRMLGRNAELFPIVDPAIKKGGDAEMKQQLKRCIPFKEINEAHRPKNVQNFSKLVRQGL